MITNYKKKKIKITLMRFFNYVDGKKPVLNELQRKTISIFRKMVTNEKSTLLTDPLNGGCYVEFEHYIKLTTTTLLIKDTTFSNYIDFDHRIGEKLVNFFYHHVSSRRSKMESVYDGNTIVNLDKILKELNK